MSVFVRNSTPSMKPVTWRRGRSSLLLRQDRLQSSPLIGGQRVAHHTLVAAPCSASSNGEVVSAAVMTASRSSSDIERIRSLMSEPGRSREVESDELMIQAALRGHGLAWVDVWSVERLPAERCLVSVFEDGSPPFPGLCFHCPSQRHISAALRGFVAMIRELGLDVAATPVGARRPAAHPRLARWWVRSRVHRPLEAARAYSDMWALLVRRAPTARIGRIGSDEDALWDWARDGEFQLIVPRPSRFGRPCFSTPQFSVLGLRSSHSAAIPDPAIRRQRREVRRLGLASMPSRARLPEKTAVASGGRSGHGLLAGGLFAGPLYEHLCTSISVRDRGDDGHETIGVQSVVALAPEDAAGVGREVV
jgi:hypothetical protein